MLQRDVIVATGMLWIIWAAEDDCSTQDINSHTTDFEDKWLHTVEI